MTTMLVTCRSRPWHVPKCQDFPSHTIGATMHLFAMRATLLFSLIACAGMLSAADARLKLSTTTSTQDAGILDVLLPSFEKKCHCQVNVIAVGTGKALKLGEAGDVDVVLVHARPLEDQFVACRLRREPPRCHV